MPALQVKKKRNFAPVVPPKLRHHKSSPVQQSSAWSLRRSFTREDIEQTGEDQVLRLKGSEAVQRMEVPLLISQLSCYWFSRQPAITVKISKGRCLRDSKLN